MSTSIITTTTFTIATVIDVQAQVPATLPVNSTLAAASPVVDDIEITACMLNALPRCGLTAEKHCGRRHVCKSAAK